MTHIHLDIKNALSRTDRPHNIGKKLCNIFIPTDVIPDSLKSRVVYKFTCAGCGARYVGETNRHFYTRVNEHIFRDKNSHIFKHLRSSKNCQDNCNVSCFKIIDSATSYCQLKIKESFHIERLKPELNKQTGTSV